MKRKIFAGSGALSLAIALTLAPGTAAAGECEMALASGLNQCNGDQVCEWFAYADYDDCLRGTTQPGPGNP